MAEIIDLEVIRGDTKQFNITVRDSNSDLFDLTGYTMVFTAKSNVELSDDNAEITSTATISVPASGVGAFTLTPSDTAVGVKTYLYDIQISNGTDSVYTIAQGDFKVTQDITKGI